jgi:cell division protein FtsW
MSPIRNKENFDKLFLGLVLALSIIGVVMVYSSTALLAISRADEPISTSQDYQFMYLKKHIMTLFISLFAMWIFFIQKTSQLKRYAYPLLAISFLLLLSVFIPGFGVKINGAQRWIQLWPSTFQPSELAKFAMVLFLSYYLSSTEYKRNSFIVFMKPIAIIVLFQAVILIQPDFGGAFTLGLISLSLLFLAGTPIRYILLLLLCSTPVLIKLLMEPYRLKRIFTFFNPWDDPYGGGFQLIQSFIALGSGGLKGVGLGESKQKLSFLPEVNTDFIFSLIGEELGLLGVSFVLMFFILLFIRGVRIAERAHSPFSYYLSYGLILMITLQALINTSVVTGLVPTKGLPLPFISYGGSSLFVNFMAVGILLRISRGEREQYTLPTHDMLVKRRARLKARRLRRGIA